MAQKREKEETELKVPETLPLCTPPIPTTPPKLSGTDDQTSSSMRSPDSLDPKLSDTVDDLNKSTLTPSPERSDLPPPPSESVKMKAEENQPEKRSINRCSGCRRKVGLMGFRCRCGELFCPEHRYSDRHDCSFDYKSAGREAIARENPVVRAAKILKV